MGTTKPQWQLDRERLFPKDLIVAAQHSERDSGVATCVTLAQWAVESGYGEHTPGNNPFGIKWPDATHRRAKLKELGASYKVLDTREEIDGKSIPQRAPFVVFPSLEAACEYHGWMLADPHGPYAELLPYLKDWMNWMPKMARVYATGSDYGKKLLNVILAYHLYDFNLPKKG